MNRALLVTPVILFVLHVSARADVIPPGTEITVRTAETIALKRSDLGRIYPAVIDRDVYAPDGELVIPRGSPAEVIVRQIGPDEFAVDLDSVTVEGRRYVINAPGDVFTTSDRPGVGKNQRTAKFLGGGALLGTIVGAIAGGGKGAAIGAAAGTASGAGAQVVTRGHELRVPAEALLTFRLDHPLYLTNDPDRGYMREGHHHHDFPEYR
jgi:hypothetical protein